MKLARSLAPWLAVVAVVGLVLPADEASAQKRGGTLVMLVQPEPPTLASYISTSGPIGQVTSKIFEGLLEYDWSLKPVPGLAESWKVSPDGKTITFTLQKGVKFHDGKPFTSADVKFSILEVLKKMHPRGPATFREVTEIDTPDAHTVIFRLAGPAPYLLMALSGYESPMLPKHLYEGTDIKASKYGNAPVGTGPFKFVEWQRGQFIRLDRNPDYWKPGRPYLDGIEYTIIADRSTRMLSFASGKFDMTFPTDLTVPLYKNMMRDAPHVKCTMRDTGVSTNLIVNRESPPFDDPKIRRALALTLDRQAFIDILSEGEGKMSGAMLPPPSGVWGMPPEMLKTIIGYDNVPANREKARELMKEAGYGPDKRLKVKVSTRNIATFRDPATILIDHLKHIYVDGELEVIDTSVYYNRVFKKDYAVALNLTGSAVDDPDVTFFEGYACGSLRNYNNYCNPEMTKLFAAQSREIDHEKRLKMVWDIDRKLQEDIARPIIAQGRAAGCWQPYVKGVVLHSNSIYNGARFEDVWLDK